MLKQISRPTWIVIIGIFICLTLVIGTITKAVQSFTYKEELAVEINSEQIDTGIRIDKESKSANTFTSYRAVPSTSIEAIDVPIFQWAKGQEDDFFNEMHQTEEKLGKDFVAHFNLDTNISKITDDLINIEMKAEQSIEQSEQYTTMKTFIVNLQQEKIIKPTMIFDEEKFTLNERFKVIQNQADGQIDPDIWEPALENLDALEIALQSDGMVFYFNDVELRENGNVPSVKVPLIQLAEYFKEEYYSILITEEEQAALEQKKLEEEQQRQEETENHKYIALTFDDGPEPETTTRILDTLNQYDAKATFFMLGKNAELYPHIAKRVADEGHEVANHTTTHANLNAVKGDRIRTEMTGSMNQIEQATGIKPTLFRPPYGNYNETVISIAEETNQSIILWSLDTNDWQHRSANATYEMVTQYAQPGSIVLMHDIHKTTADALPQIMQRLTNEGYEFVTVSELLPYLEEEGIGPYRGN